MIFYIIPSIIFIISFADYIKGCKLKKSIFMLTLFILTVVCTFRSISTESFYGYDTNSYVEFYNDSYLDNNLNLELGYKFINIVVHIFTDNYRYLFFIISAVTMLYIYKYITYNTHNIFIALLAYISIFYYIRDFSQIRASLAYAIAIYGTRYIIEENGTKFLLNSILATTIHSSAIFILLLYPIKKFQIKKIYLYIILLISIILTQIDWMKSFANLLSQFSYNNYIRSFIIYTNYYEPRGLDSKFILYIAIAFCGVYIKDIKNIKSKIYDINIYILVFGIFIAGLFNGSEVISIRLSELYLTSIIVVISKFKHITTNKNIELIVVIITSVILIIYNFLLIKSLAQHGTIHYI